MERTPGENLSYPAKKAAAEMESDELMLSRHSLDALVKPKSRCHNEKSESAADDEYGQAPFAYVDPSKKYLAKKAAAADDEFTETIEYRVEWILSNNTQFQKEVAELWSRHGNYLNAAAKLKSSRQAPENPSSYVDPSKVYLAKKAAAAVDECTEKIESHVQRILTSTAVLQKERKNYKNACELAKKNFFKEITCEDMELGELRL